MELKINNMTFTDSNIIDLLGSTSKVAKLCKVAPAAVTQWRTNGIPAGHLMFLAATLEKESCGLVSRKDLFPKSYQVIWPELQ